jgi:hypothetical protein
MKLIRLFDEFLADTVNLNQTRFNDLENSINAIEKFITNSDWQPKILEYKAQGSWAHKTIIKPLPDQPFDADLLVYVNPVKNWEAKDYLDTLYSKFKNNATYSEKVRRYSHCITIEYAKERKIDIAPCVKERLTHETYEVCNRNINSFEKSNPKDYTSWIIAQNKSSQKNNLRKITRLLKYLRDIKTRFTCPSFLLTTLIGKQIIASDIDDASFADLPSALITLVGRLDDWLQATPIKPDVRNPVLSSEVQSNAWDDAKYQNFRNQINRYRIWMDDAYSEVNQEESMAKWRRVFGEDFAKSEVKKKASRISVIACESYTALGRNIKDLVEGVIQLGIQALPPGFTKLPHMHQPKWKDGSGGMFTVNIQAHTSDVRFGYNLTRTMNLSPLRAAGWIKFSAITVSAIPFPADYKIVWRITNTDTAAEAADALRGEFNSSTEHGVRWERLSFRGVHIVEAYVIKISDDRLYGKSDPFFVVIM